MKHIIKAIEWLAVIGGVIIIVVIMLVIWSVDQQANKQNIKDANKESQPKTELIKGSKKYPINNDKSTNQKKLTK